MPGVILLKRDFQRIDSKGALDICLGMSAVHYYLANQQPFEKTIKSQQATVVEYQTDNSAPDIWANAFDADTIFESDPLQTDLIEYEPETTTAHDSKNQSTP